MSSGLAGSVPTAVRLRAKFAALDDAHVTADDVVRIWALDRLGQELPRSGGVPIAIRRPFGLDQDAQSGDLD